MIAGDVSGDLHTARLAKKLLERQPDWTLHALGGPHLRAAVAKSPGSSFLGDTSGCSAIGILAASRIYIRCKVLGRRVYDFLERQRVDAIVLCDWGGFNGRLLPNISRLGIPILYYFPPRSWQRTGAAGLGIARFVTRVATPFQWSAERLRAAGCQAEWVGHPSIESIRERPNRAALRAEFGVKTGEPLIALLPGSRRSEIKTLAPRLAETAGLLRSKRAVSFVAVVPKEMKEEAVSLLPAWIPVVTERATDLLLACDAAIVKTGTATIEAVLAGAPQVAIYDFSPVLRLEWCLLWAWKKIPFVAMPNIILQRMAIPECLGPNCRPGNIERAISTILDDEPARSRMRRDYSEICLALGSDLPMPATERTAEIVEEMVAGSKRPVSVDNAQMSHQ